MRRRPSFRLFAVLGLAALPLLSACEIAPGTGRTIFTGGMSADQESQLGYQQHQKIVPQFGGAYSDPALTSYVGSIGNLLARTSETPDTKFTFTVLDTPMVNAFALPGGYVYVTRGLLSLADNEAEVAGVLAHEIGHVTARHAAERYGQTMAANVFGVGLGLLLGSDAATDLYAGVVAVALRSYSREQEYESDLLGVRYMARAGYDPGAMASFLSRLQAHSRFESELRGEPGKADQFDILQTHPRTADRIARAIQQAGARTVADPMTARDIYLDKIDGMLFGDNPQQGFVRGHEFLHPELRFAFEVVGRPVDVIALRRLVFHGCGRLALGFVTGDRNMCLRQVVSQGMQCRCKHDHIANTGGLYHKNSCGKALRYWQYDHVYTCIACPARPPASGTYYDRLSQIRGRAARNRGRRGVAEQ